MSTNIDTDYIINIHAIACLGFWKITCSRIILKGTFSGEKKVYGSLKFSAKLKGGEEMIP